MINITNSDLDKFNIATAFDQQKLELGEFRKSDESLHDFKGRVMMRLRNHLSANTQGLTDYYSIEQKGRQYTYGFITDPLFEMVSTGTGVQVTYNAVTRDYPFYTGCRFILMRDIFEDFAFQFDVLDKEGNPISVAGDNDFLDCPIIYLQEKDTMGVDSFIAESRKNIHLLNYVPTSLLIPVKSPVFKTEVVTAVTEEGEYQVIGTEKKVITYTAPTVREEIIYTYTKDSFEIIISDIAIYDIDQAFAETFLFDDMGHVTPFGFDVVPEMLANNDYWGE